jgi:hypothetical protein
MIERSHFRGDILLEKAPKNLRFLFLFCNMRKELQVYS